MEANKTKKISDTKNQNGADHINKIKVRVGGLLLCLQSKEGERLIDSIIKDLSVIVFLYNKRLIQAEK